MHNAQIHQDSYGPPTHWDKENRQLHIRLREQETWLLELDKAKISLDQCIEKILEEVQNRECRAKELEDKIATLLNVVTDRDQQLAKRENQFETRNQQFNALMSFLSMQQPSEQSDTETHNQLTRQLPHTPAKSNKCQNTLPTPSRENDWNGMEDTDMLIEAPPDTTRQKEC